MMFSLYRSTRVALVSAAIVFAATSSFAQTNDAAATPDNVAQPEAKRLFGIIPNFKTSPMPTNYVPLTAKRKFVLASQDSFDRGTILLAAVFAGSIS